MCGGLAYEIKNQRGGLRSAVQLLAMALPNPALIEYTKVIIEQADCRRNLVDRLLGPQRLSLYITQSIHQVVERVFQLVSLEKPYNVKLVRDYDPSLFDITNDPEQIEQVVAIVNITRNALSRALGDAGGIITLAYPHYVPDLPAWHFLPPAGGNTASILEITRPRRASTVTGYPFYPMFSGREGGTGLGLSIAGNLIDQHCGKIEFNSCGPVIPNS